MKGISLILYKANLTLFPVCYLPCWLDDRTLFDSQIWTAGTLCCASAQD